MLYLKTKKVSFLGTHMQRGASPEVSGVDLRSVSQQVLDNQVLIGGRGYLKSGLRTETQHNHNNLDQQSTLKNVEEPAWSTRVLYLSIVFFCVQRAASCHVCGEHISQSTFTLSHRDVKTPGSLKGRQKIMSMCECLGCIDWVQWFIHVIWFFFRNVRLWSISCWLIASVNYVQCVSITSSCFLLV